MLKLIEWLLSRGKAGSIPAASTINIMINMLLRYILHNNYPWTILGVVQTPLSKMFISDQYKHRKFLPQQRTSRTWHNCDEHKRE